MAAAIMAAGLMALPVAGAGAFEAAPDKPSTVLLQACVGAAELPDCLRNVLEGSVQGAAQLEAVRLLGPRGLAESSTQPTVLASVLAADRRGAPPAQTLAPLAALPLAQRLDAADWLCAGAAPADASGPAYRTWYAQFAPSRGLLTVVTEALAAADPTARGGEAEDFDTRLGLINVRTACLGALGDSAAILRVRAESGAFMERGGPANDLLAMLAMRYGRLDEAAALVESHDALGEEPSSPVPAGFGPWPAFRLLKAAIAGGRLDIADRAAILMLERAERGRGGLLSPALGWLVRRPAREALAPRLAVLSRRVRPGAPDWDWRSAVAIHRSLIAIGDLAGAKAYEAVVWNGQPGREDLAGFLSMRAALLADDGRWDEAAAQERSARAAATPGEPYGGFGALAVNRLETDVDFGEAEARLPLHLAHAVSPASRVELLAFCATTAGRSLALDFAAGCARQLTPLLAAEPALTANPDAANAYFMVAWFAARADRLDLAREMLAAGLRYCPPDQMSSKLGVIFEVVAIDLHARGKL